MRFFLYSLLILAFCPAVFSADKDAPARKRPRIRVYDQSANVMTQAPSTTSTQQMEKDLERKLRDDISAPNGFQNPVDLMPVMSPLSTSNWNAQDEEEDEDEEDWITVDNFLLKEDLLEKEASLNPEEVEDADNGEMEITDWEALQKSMIEDALKKDAPDLSDEEMEEMLVREAETEDEVLTEREFGMEMAEVAPVQDLNATSPDTRQLGVLSSDTNPGQFVPILQSQGGVAGEVNRPQRERDPRMELSGSRALLNDIKEKWSQPAELGAGNASTAFNGPGLPTESLMSRQSSHMNSGSLLSTGNPVVSPMPLPGPAPQPMRTQPTYTAPEPAAAAPSAFPKTDFRVRSRIGSPSGL